MIEEAKIVEIDYVNHRGERSARRVFPVKLEFHPEVGWTVQAVDLTCPPGSGGDSATGRLRCFALAGTSGWRPVAEGEGPEGEQGEEGAENAPTREGGNRDVPQGRIGGFALTHPVLDPATHHHRAVMAFADSRHFPAGGPEDAAWARRRAAELAAESGEPAVAFPEGVLSPVNRERRMPCVALLSQLSEEEAKRGEKFMPPAKEAGGV